MRVTLIELWGREAMLHYASQLANSLAHEPDLQVSVILPRNSDTSLFEGTVEISYVDVVMDASLRELMLAPVKLARLPAFFKAIKGTRPDILHLNNCHVWYIFSLARLKQLYPIVSTMHDVEPHPGQDDSWRKRREIDALARFSDHIFVHGENLRQIVCSNYPFLAPDQITVIPHGEYSLFSRYPTEVSEDENTVLLFGRIRAYKGLEYLLRASPIVTQHLPNARFIVAGDGDLRSYQDLFNGQRNIEFINRYIPNEEVGAIFSRAALVVLPYTQASQSGIISAAYAFKKSVVVTNVGCLPDLVEDGKTGLIIPPGDVPALANAIVKLLQDNELRKTMGQNGYSMMKAQLGWDKIASTTKTIYNKVLDEI